MELRYKIVTFSQSSCSDVCDETAVPAVVCPSCQFAHRFGCDVANISISMNISPLPSLDICHDSWSLDFGWTDYLATFFLLPSSNDLLSQCEQARNRQDVSNVTCSVCSEAEKTIRTQVVKDEDDQDVNHVTQPPPTPYLVDPSWSFLAILDG